MDRIILASASPARKKMLQEACIEFDAIPAHIDEPALMAQLLEGGADAEHIAETLAQEKALAVSRLQGEALVIGSDQVLECDGRIFSKAKTREEAAEKLRSLSGKAHHLVSAACVVKNGAVLWHAARSAKMIMHDFDAAYVERYLDKAGHVATSCVGAYALEQIGVRLFEKIEGNYFTVLGMPLMPLLNYLRLEQGLDI